MHTSQHDTTEHPLLDAVLRARDLLSEQADTPAWGLDASATTRLVKATASLLGAVSEVEARAVAQAAALDLAGAAQMKSTAVWLARTTLVNESTAHAKVRLATALGAHDATRTTMAAGCLHVEQATAITRAISHLDTDQTVVSAADRVRAEVYLLDHAIDHDARQLATLGHRLVEVIDPAGADAHEANLLARQEQRARAHSSLRMRDDGEGLTRGTFAIPTAQATMLAKALTAIAAPKATRARTGAGTHDHRKPSAARHGQAFVTYIERFPVHRLPKVGGLNATVIATGDHQILQGAVKAARLDTGAKISHLEYLRMACEAGIVPAWMDTSTGRALSLGRKHRFHQPHQRLALILERETCETTSCQTPAWLCHVHHDHPWHEGGTTDTVTAQLHCPFHHHQIHAGGTRHPIRK